ncbi:MAG: hypothetical protein ACUVRA_06745 [Candidatus Bathyarchaeaceae archaeon]
MTLCAVCGREASRLHACCEGGTLVYDLFYVEAVDMCTHCEGRNGLASQPLSIPIVLDFSMHLEKKIKIAMKKIMTFMELLVEISRL